MSDFYACRSACLSTAWADAFHYLMDVAGGEATPLIVRIDVADGHMPSENADIRSCLDRHLFAQGGRSSQTTAATIFPISLWNPAHPDAAAELYRRYERIWPRIKKHGGNRYGVYFRRLTNYSPRTGEPVNQLKKIVEIYKAGNHRRSALQAVVFDPVEDLNRQKQRGFPCLQQLAFCPTQAGLEVTAFFGSQFFFDRAYGNFVGLCDLGRFMASQLGFRFAGITSVAGVAALGKNKNVLVPLDHEISAIREQAQGDL